MREGSWYMEVKILHGGGEHVSEESRREGSHVRLGWGRREAPLNGPVGLDGYSYGYRDKLGEKVTLSRPHPYGRSFGTGDVIGMYISLPPRRKPHKNDPHDPAHLKRERIPIDLKGQEVFEILEYPQSKEMIALMDYSGKNTNSASVPSSSKKMANGKLPERNGPTVSTSKPAGPPLRPLPILPGSRIAFFVNGECQGTAFEDLYDYLPLRQTDAQKASSRKRAREGVKEHKENPFDDGTLGYYPFISVFNDASVRLNPGPDFEFPPPKDIDALLNGIKSSSEVKNAPASVLPEMPPKTASLSIDLDLNNEDVKPIIDPTTLSVLETAPSPSEVNISKDKDEEKSRPEAQKTWRPACERYPEFMEEEWAFDEIEEEQAKEELSKYAAQEKAEEDRRKQREKRRQQAEARKKAKAKQAADAALAEDERERERERERAREKEFKMGSPLSNVTLYGPGGLYTSNYPSPSPLRHSTAYDPEGSVEYEHSPAPTFASNENLLIEVEGVQSGYTSENHDQPDDMDVDQEIEALMGSPGPRSPSTS